MANAQVVIYNGKTLPFAAVSYSGRAVYDSTDRTFQGYEFSFRIKFLVLGDPTNSKASTPQAFQTQLRSYMAALSTPRKRFLWTSAGQTLWDIGPGDEPASGDGYADRRWGPKPRVMNVQQIPGGISAWMEVTIDAFITPCSGVISDVEEFTWEFSYSFDENYTCTRTLTGTYKVASPFSAPLTFLQDGLLWPGIPLGFARRSINHTTSRDGTTINWTITDQQLWRTLPRPLTGGTASYSIEQSGATMTRTLQGWFSAPFTIRKQIIFQFILDLFATRFATALIPPGGEEKRTEYITSFRIINEEFDNKVSFSFTSRGSATQLLAQNRAAFVPNAFMGNVLQDVADIVPTPVNADPAKGIDLSWNPEWEQVDGRAYSLGVTGTAGLVPAVTNPISVCASAPSAIGDTNASSGGDPEALAPVDEVTDPSTPVGAGGTPPDVGLSPDHVAFPYISYHEQIDYIADHNLSLLSPLDDTKAAIVQRTAPIAVKAIQIGHARRLGKTVTVPKPLRWDLAGVGSSLSDDESFVQFQSVRPSAPKLIGDGRTLEFSAAWSYVVLLPTSHGIVGAFFREIPEDLESDTTKLNQPTDVYYPNNPMLANPDANEQVRDRTQQGTVDIEKAIQHSGGYNYEIDEEIDHATEV